jgi:hypothetical protein
MKRDTKRAWAGRRSRSGNQPNSALGVASARVLHAGRRTQVWFTAKGRPVCRVGTVDARLAADARRYGQDLVNVRNGKGAALAEEAPD